MTRNTTTFASLAFSASLLACGGGNKSTAPTMSASDTTALNTMDPAPCSPEECATVADPEITPKACGEKNDKVVSTTCSRDVETNVCHKVISCQPMPKPAAAAQ